MNRLGLFFAKLVTFTLAVLITDWMLPGIQVDGVPSAIFLSIVLSLLNILVKPLLILFTLPITVFSFGIFLFVINAMMILLAAWLVPGFNVDGFWWALAFSLLLSLTASVLETIGLKSYSSNRRNN
ncbi:MAG: phage holin family protein [Bacteroidia bacterium]